MCLLEQGLILRTQDRWDEALEVLDQAASRLSMAGQRDREARAALAAMVCLRSLQRLDEVVSRSVGTRQLYKELDRPEGAAASLRMAAHALLRSGRSREALPAFDLARQEFEALGSMGYVADCLEGRAAAEESLGLAEEALASNSEATAVRARLLDDPAHARFGDPGSAAAGRARRGPEESLRLLLDGLNTDRRYATREDGLWVASALQYFLDVPAERGHLVLEVLDIEGHEHSLRVRPLLDQDFESRQDGSQVITCVTKDGRMAGIALPAIADRTALPAIVELLDPSLDWLPDVKA